MKFAPLLALVASTLAFAPAHAIDPGVAKGQLAVDGRTILLTHAYAHQHDNEEGLLDARELRILLADREVPQSLLAGIATADLYELARKGAVQGVLLTADPATPASGTRGLLLMREPDPAKSLTSFSMSGGDGGFGKLQIANNRVQGEAHHESRSTRPAMAYAATFSAPLFHEEPLSGKFSGAQAMESAPFRALAAYHKALGAADLEAARRLATSEHFRGIDALVAQAGKPAALKVLRETMALPGARDKPRVFVRDRHALIVYRAGKGRGMQSMRQSGGVWLVD